MAGMETYAGQQLLFVTLGPLHALKARRAKHQLQTLTSLRTGYLSWLMMGHRIAGKDPKAAAS